jgi:hypothetical protein
VVARARARAEARTKKVYIKSYLSIIALSASKKKCADLSRVDNLFAIYSLHQPI